MESLSFGQKQILSWRSIILAVIATLGFGYLAFGGIDANEILQAMSRVSAWTIAGALALFLIATTLRVMRWWLLLRRFHSNLPVSACVSPFLLGIAANDLLPVRIGDLVKMFANRKAIQVLPSTRLGTIVMERIFDIISILLIFFLGALYLDIPSLELLKSAAYAILMISLITLFGLLFFSKAAENWIFFFLELKPFRKITLTKKSKEWTSQFFETFRKLSYKNICMLFLLSCAIWSVEGTMALVIALGIDPSVGALGPYLSLACGALSNFLPSAPGQIGTLDYFLQLGVLGYGMSKTSAIAFALLVHLIFLGFSVVVSVILIHRKSTWKIFKNL